MKPDEFVRVLSDTYPEGQRELSRSMGRTSNWIATMLSNGTKPRLDTAAAIADACGYELVVRERSTGRELGRVEPPRPAE